MNNEPLIIERVYNAPIESVWMALTDIQQLRQWYFDIADFKAEVGFEFSFTGGSEDRKYTHLCKVTAVNPGRTLSYSWKYEGLPGDSVVTFELFGEGDKTRVRLTHTGIESMSSNGADFMRSSFTEGWTYIIGKSLKEFVEGQLLS